MPEMFWLVWCPTGPTNPKRKHKTPVAAMAEAERMAALHIDQEFFVLASLGSTKKESSSGQNQNNKA